MCWVESGVEDDDGVFFDGMAIPNCGLGLVM